MISKKNVKLADRIVGEQKKVLFAEAELKKSKAELRKLTDEVVFG